MRDYAGTQDGDASTILDCSRPRYLRFGLGYCADTVISFRFRLFLLCRSACVMRRQMPPESGYGLTCHFEMPKRKS